MRLGYNTNGLAHHRWDQAIELIAATGYRSVAITVDHHCLDPRAPQWRTDLQRMQKLLSRHQLHCVIETGARYLLDPWRKHQPTLLSETREERRLRINFLLHCLFLARELSADAVSFWSGTPLCSAPESVLWQRLCDGCLELVETAERANVRLAFEPEPGMFVATCDQFAQLAQKVNSDFFGLTLDIGHVHCLQDGSITDRLRQFAGQLWNVHIEDCRIGQHEHLPFGQGTIDFEAVFATLREIQYPGGVHVELSRDSHRAPEALRESIAFLSRWS